LAGRKPNAASLFAIINFSDHEIKIK